MNVAWDAADSFKGKSGHGLQISLKGFDPSNFIPHPSSFIQLPLLG
jgi:hypothetical protein